MKQLVVPLTAVALAAGCTENVSFQPPLDAGKVAYTNANIFTQNDQQPWAQTIITDGDRITYIGDSKTGNAFVDADTRVVDLNNQFVMPGMIDTHTHPGLVASLQIDDSQDLEEQRIPKGLSRRETVEWLKAYSDKNPWKPVITLGEWDVNAFLPNGPTKEELDEAFSLRPAIIFDNSGHSLWVNSSALTLFGVDQDTADLSPGISYFVRDENGDATGWVKEFALMPELKDYMLPDAEDLKANLLEYLTFLSEHGITTLWDAGNFAWHDDIYRVVAELDRENKLPLNYEGTFHIWSPEQLKVARSELLRLRKEYAGNRLQFNTIKIHYDGVAEIQTAGMLDPYINTEDNRGGVLFDAQELSEFLLDLNEYDINLHLHVVGDHAAREALDAVEMAQRQSQLNIEVALSHLETVHPDDIPRFKQLGVHANFTPHWFGGTVFGEAGATNLGEARRHYQQAANDFVQAGANVTLSSDVVSEAESHRANPFIGLQMSMTRQEYSHGPEAKIVTPLSARLSFEDALAAYTINSAHQMGLKNQVGSLEVGKKADFLVLSQNPFEVDTYQLHKLKPEATIVDGLIVSGSLTP